MLEYVLIPACGPVFVSPRSALERAQHQVADGRVEGKRHPDIVVNATRAPRGEAADAAKEELAREAVVLQDAIAHPLEDVVLEQNLEISLFGYFELIYIIWAKSLVI